MAFVCDRVSSMRMGLIRTPAASADPAQRVAKKAIWERVRMILVSAFARSFLAFDTIELRPGSNVRTQEKSRASVEQCGPAPHFRMHGWDDRPLGDGGPR